MASLKTNIRQANADFQAIKNKIIDNGVPVAAGTKTAEYASKVDEVYAAGKKSEYDAFWDEFQNYGSLNTYCSKFSNSQSSNTWTDATYNPKYELDCTSSNHLGAQGVFQYTTQIKDLKVPMNCRGAKMNNTFNYCHVVRIPLLRVDENTTFMNTFGSASKLEELTIEGVIGQNGLNLQWSIKLSHDSLMSTINALKDYSSDTSGTEWVVTIGSENLAKLTPEEINIAEQKGWNIV